MDLSLYKKRLKSTSLPEAFINDTITIVNQEFSQSPNIKTIKVDGVEIECNFNNTKKSTKKELLFRPRTKVEKGLYVNVDDDVYLIMDVVPNEIYPKAEIELCNNTLKLRDSLNNVVEYKCVMKGNSFEQFEEKVKSNELVKVVTDVSEMFVYLPYDNNTKMIKPKQRFIVNDSTFDVFAIDDITNVYKGKGFIRFTFKATSMSPTDDVSTGVVDEGNSSSWEEGGW